MFSVERTSEHLSKEAHFVMPERWRLLSGFKFKILSYTLSVYWLLFAKQNLDSEQLLSLNSRYLETETI